ncbi:hypothetical protein B0J13DRAFT_649674 [Dactylonectria estremocensis]|uniref:AB hydrolase-1 domain-containing protein n=1 Tax=Dactylonectria estremocensis TaxID=1079267 RepID=A0A9P9DKE5_9HYPO|nr:hypothetical protein B0J13DRAFT_649674 [Dactylonectria estremocensis]
MTQSSVWKYAFIRTSIFFLHLIAPFSIFYSLVSSLLVLKTVFYCAMYLPHNAYLQRGATHPTTASRKDRRKLFWQCHRNIPDPDRYLQKWFRNAPATEIKRENVKDFFRWAFLNTGDSDPAHDEELEEYAREIEKLLGRKLEPGHGNAQCLQLTLDKVEMLHRSLAWYLCVFIVNTIASAYMYYHSFDFYRTSFLAIFPLRPLTLFSAYCCPAKTLTYWYRPHQSTTKLPILFIHGIGIGLYPYINFLGELTAADAKDPITAAALLKDEICEEINRILTAHGWSRIVLVSHSYGSVVAAHLLHTPQIVQKIGPIVFVDPVSFLLHLPDVAYNFICRKPARANEHLLSYFGSKDMGVSHTLFRRFFWADNALWKEDIQGHRASVMLAGSDIVIDTKTIGAHWEDGIWKGDGLDVVWFQDLDHGQVFDKRSRRGRLVDIVRRFCVEG